MIQFVTSVLTLPSYVLNYSLTHCFLSAWWLRSFFSSALLKSFFLILKIERKGRHPQCLSEPFWISDVTSSPCISSIWTNDSVWRIESHLPPHNTYDRWMHHKSDSLSYCCYRLYGIFDAIQYIQFLIVCKCTGRVSTPWSAGQFMWLTVKRSILISFHFKI